jgi:hypothetical protein
MFDIKDCIEYHIVSSLYGDKTAKRSGIPLLNHINEGLVILNEINASELAKRAYCLHPVLQDNIALTQNYKQISEFKIDISVAITTMEYRRVANNYLSKRIINSIDEIELSPLLDVNDMLIADKVQNRKDFELYHLGKHERSDILDQYFKNWLERLEITEERYQELIKLL